MWTRADSIETRAAPEKVFALFADVERWKDWNAGIESIELHGPFAVGTRFTMRPPGQDAITSTLLAVSPDGFTDETIVDDTRVLVHHRLTALANGTTRIEYATEITGPHADEIGAAVTADFPDVLAALKRLAESSTA